MESTTKLAEDSVYNGATENNDPVLQKVKVYNHSCSICNDTENKYLLLASQCGHLYDGYCIVQFVKIRDRDITCAVCRGDIFPLTTVFKKNDDDFFKCDVATKISKDDCNEFEDVVSTIMLRGTQEEIKYLLNDINKYNADVLENRNDPKHSLYQENTIDPLNSVIKTDNIELISLILKCGIDFQYKDKDGNSYLHRAKHLETVTLFANNYPALLTVTNNQGYTPLYTYIEKERNDIVEVLIEHEQDINKVINGITALDIAFSSESVDMTCKLMAKGADINILIKNIFKFMSSETNSANLSFLKEMINSFNIDINFKDTNSGNNFVHVVKSYDLMEYLISQGASVTNKNNNGDTPLLSHIDKGSSLANVKLLLKHSDISFQDNKGENALELAVNKERFDILHYFHTNGLCNYNDYIKTEQHAFLFAKYCIGCGDDNSLKEIVAIDEFNINYIDNNTGNNLLHELNIRIEKISNLDNIFKLLIKEKINVSLQNNEGNTPLHTHLIKGSYSLLIELLIKSSKQFNLLNNESKSVLDIAFLKGYHSFCDILVDKNTKFKFVKDNIFKYVRYKYSRYGDFDDYNLSIALLISKSKDIINIQNPENNNTLLHEANESYNVAETIIKKGANINAQNIDGNTPLHLRISEGQISIAELLIEKGAKTNLKNKDGKTALALVIESDERRLIDAITSRR